jgi:hypothetical protein
MGDDIPDIKMMKVSGISACPPNSVAEVKAISDYISPIYGGKGAVRDVIEQVMKVQGNWEEDDTQYLSKLMNVKLKIVLNKFKSQISNLSNLKSQISNRK